MERMTEYGETGVAYLKHEYSPEEAIQELAAYESTDAVPEEIGSVIDWCRENELHNLVGLLNAIATDRVVVLPYNIGAVVYVIDRNTVCKGFVRACIITKRGISVEVEYNNFGLCSGGFLPSAVYSDRESAMAALKRTRNAQK